MAHIKKMVMYGFKSFAKKIEIPFDKGINVVIGPNGSGKSNISDAICFCLGRLSIKSMRAEKAKNLIFMGSKYVKPAKEAFVEIYFDNSNRDFSIEKDELVLKRIVRINGQSIYKINGETKTRAEVIETLAQAGIDPHGYNMILQGQIQSIVKMHGDERRKIIGEVAGISVYEWRKEKSLKELEKTDVRLKEIMAILRDRTAYLNQLEKEKSQAQKYRDLQTLVQRCKASITKKKIDDKKKEVDGIVKTIEGKTRERDKRQEKVEKVQQGIEGLSEKINQINKHIRDVTGLEQGRLREEITNLKAELEGLRVRKEGQEHRADEVEHRISEMEKSIPESEGEIKELRKESPMMAKKAEDLKKKKDELSLLEKERKRLLTLKTELSALVERIGDKKENLARAGAESESLVKQIEEITKGLIYNNDKDALKEKELFEGKLSKIKDNIEALVEEELNNEKIISVAESEVKLNEKTKGDVNKLDTCPLCKTEISDEHRKHVIEDCENKIEQAISKLEKTQFDLSEARKKRLELRDKIDGYEDKLRNAEKELVVLKTVEEKKELLKKNVGYEDELRKEIDLLGKKRRGLEVKGDDFGAIDSRYEDKMHEIEEISSRTEEDLDTTLLYKERELEKIKSIVERSKEDLEEIEQKVFDLGGEIDKKEEALEDREKKDEELAKRFEKMYNERDEAQKGFQEANVRLTEMQSEVRQIEDQTNYLKIGKSKIEGEKQVLEMDMSEYVGVEILQGSTQVLEEKLRKSQATLETIGSINMRALEVYDEIKGEYDVVREKAETIGKEKNDILKIIGEIDKKKRRTFMKTFRAINELFSKNFAKLSAKGVAYLEVNYPVKKKENGKEVSDDLTEKDVSEANVDIIVKMAKGKYFDVHSLSGGEQTLVALSLLFAIQEFRPYHFYILDEIDAALDKRNSERLADLLEQYTKAGQYIIVTHNDAIIMDSDILYGVSMHDGVSKVLSLKLGDSVGKDEGSN